MGRPKKSETIKNDEAVMVDVQVKEEAVSSEPIKEQDEQLPNEIEEVDFDAETSGEQNTSVEEDLTEKISPREEELMRLYPQYEKIWITPKGFVHPEGVPQYLLKGAKLFKNKYFNNKK